MIESKDSYGTNNYFLLMDYRNFNFKDLNEQLKKGFTYWHIPAHGKNAKDKIFYTEKECKEYCDKKDNKYKEGDKVYIFVTHLPNTKNSNTRILFRGEIDSSPKPVETSKFCYKPKGEWCKAIKIKSIKTLSRPDLNNDNILNRSQYGIATPQGICDCSKIKNKKSVNKIIEDCNRMLTKDYTSMFDILEEVFGHKCLFGCSDKRSTFIQRNGFRYYELHHFIQQHLCKGKEKNKISKLIDRNENKIWLCAKCHRQIHHGSKEEVKQMIDDILSYIKKSENGKNLLLELKKEINAGTYNDVKEWIYSMYKCSD